MPKPPDRLTLRSGSVVADPLDRLLEFVKLDGTYQRFDQVEVDPFELTAVDITLANRIIARMGTDVSVAILERASAVGEALRRIAPDATLAAATDALDWSALADLYRSLDGVPAVGVARLTKVLHRKRPALVPILDEVVRSYLLAVERLPATGSVAEQALALTRDYQRELLHLLPELAALRSALAMQGIDLTECRILDILLWAYSGTYTPLWQRRAVGVHPGSSSYDYGGSGDSVSIDAWGRLPDSLSRYLDDDDGYSGWLSAHPQGWVLNCDRQPKATYLKLHRASCIHLQPRPEWSNLTKAFAKVCGTSPGTFDEWLAAALGAQPDRCPTCTQ